MLKIARWLTLVLAATALSGCVVVPRGYWGGHHHNQGWDDRGGHHGGDGHRGRGRGGDRWR